MRAAICHEPGKGLVIEEIASPPVRGGEVKLAVKACGVNFADALMIQGLYQVKPPPPFTPGLEIAGDVIECGEGVTHLQPGDRVLAVVNYGAFAEEVVVPAPIAIPIPDSMTYADAAAFPVAYGTSHIALTDRAHLQPGETLLVLGAAGGVGLTAVEIGKKLGATVITAASTSEKLALTQQYGADHIMNYREENFRDRVRAITGGAGVDVVYDPVGGDVFEEASRVMNWAGRYLIIGFASGTIPQVAVNRLLIRNSAMLGVYWGAYMLNNPATMLQSLHTLLGWYAEGALKPHISATYPLEQTTEAIQSLSNRASTGKVVVTIE